MNASLFSFFLSRHPNRARVFALLLLVCVAGCAKSLTVVAPPTTQSAGFNIRHFGAVGDGVTKDTQAVQKALDACAISGGGEVRVPAGKYLIGSVQMGRRTTLRLEPNAVLIGSGDINDYPMIDVRWEGRWQAGHRALIHAANVDDIAIVGPGRIEANADVAKSQNPRGVVAIETISCTNVHWEGFTVTQGENWAIHPTYCRNVLVKDVIIRGGRDGIDVDSCANVRIEHCDIDTGDDSISLKSGRGADGARIGKPVEDVVISNCLLRCRSFACVGIGSETSAGVKNVRIEHCTMSAKSNAIYIKSKIGRAGVNENISVDDVDIFSGGFLQINLVGAGNKNTTDDPIEGAAGIPLARNLRFTRIRLHDARSIVEAVQIPPEKPIEGFVLQDVSGTASQGIRLQHIRNAEISNISVKVQQGDLLAIDDVTGTGLEHAAKYMKPASTEPSTAPATRPVLDRPDPNEIPLPKIHTSMPDRPGVNELPIRKDMPDLLTRDDGTKITTAQQWPARRTEVLGALEYYATGQAPPPPGNVKGTVVHSESVVDGPVNYNYRLVHLTFGPQEQLSLNIGIFTPLGDGPFPAVIAPAGTPPGATALPTLPKGPTQGKGTDALLLVGGGVAAIRPATSNQATTNPTTAPNVPGDWFGGKSPDEIAARIPAMKRGYAYIIYNNNDCGEDTTLRNADGSWAYRDTRFFPAYPNYDWGLLRSWAWGASRIVDYLETDRSIDKSKLIITGASRTGKSAMMAGAFDERFALVAPCVTGGAGIGAHRFTGAGRSETLTAMVRKYPNWFSPNLHQFWGQPEKLPFDQHWFLGAIAPRPFIALEGKTDDISLPSAVKQTFDHARGVYDLLGASEKLGVHYSDHGHVFNTEDWTALLDFADIHLRGIKMDKKFDQFYKDPTPAPTTSPATQPSSRPVVRLWDGDAPGAQGTQEIDIPTIKIWLASAEKSTGAIFVVCPGGGYGHLANHEGDTIAEWLNSLGVNAVVLKYRLGPKYHHPVELGDALRAVRFVRAHAAEWKIDPARVGIIGFSAGGHLASSTITHFDDGNPDAADEIDRQSSRPDLAILAYPVITFQPAFTHKGSLKNLLGDDPDPKLVELLSNEKQVTEKTPPCFIMHTNEDPAVPVENSLMFAAACRAAKVPVELHIYEKGRHGVGLATGDPVLSTWPKSAELWLQRHGYVK